MGDMRFLKGMGAGLIVGACMGMAVMPDKKQSKKMVSKAVKTAESIVSDLADIMGL